MAEAYLYLDARPHLGNASRRSRKVVGVEATLKAALNTADEHNAKAYGVSNDCMRGFVVRAARHPTCIVPSAIPPRVTRRLARQTAMLNLTQGTVWIRACRF
jgi:hypothetical protein